MVILATADFYGEFELYETIDPDDLEKWLADMVNERYRKLDLNKHKIIGSHETMTTDDALKMSDATIWINDLVEV